MRVDWPMGDCSKFAGGRVVGPFSKWQEMACKKMWHVFVSTNLHKVVFLVMG